MITRIKKYIRKHQKMDEFCMFFKNSFWILRNRFLIRKPHSDNKANKQGVVLLYTVRSLPRGNPLVYLETIMAYGFEKLGYNVKMLFCDGVLSGCDAETHYRPNDQKRFCHYCSKYRSALIKSLSLEDYFVSFKDFISSSKAVEINNLVDSMGVSDLVDCNYIYHGVNVGQSARASAIRYYLSGKLDFSIPDRQKKLRECLKNAIIVVEVINSFVKKFDVKKVIMLHGIYSTWGPAYEYFRANNIEVIVYSKGTIKNESFMFLKNGRELESLSSLELSKLKERQLSPKEFLKVKAFLDSRFQRKGADLLMYKKIKDKNDTEAFGNFASDCDGYKYVIFTHLAWDACFENQSDAFVDFYDMLYTTIRYFCEHTQKRLIIKLHPAESVWEEGTQSIGNHISEFFPNLPDNIVVLSPTTNLSAYDIIDDRTVAITYVGSVGPELSARGVPVLVGGHIRYCDEAGVGIFIKSKEDYFNHLTDSSPLFNIAAQNLDNALKWCYYYSHMLHMDMPFFSSKKWVGIDWYSLRNIGKWLADENSTLMHICKSIADGKDVVNH